jgi:SNF2 family DNA or RNA helicase
MEYYTMVNFVKPNLLGNIQEFRNRFSNIIEKGRSKDADRVHVRAMRHRCHVLYRKLEGVVDRKSHGVIASEVLSPNCFI